MVVYIVFLVSVMSLGSVIMSDEEGELQAQASILSFNIHSANQDFKRFHQWITQNQPDVLLLQELTPICEVFLRRELSELYPIQKLIARSDNFGIGILVHKKYLGREIDFIEHVLANETPLLELRLNSSSIFNAHLMPPLNNKLHQIRETQLKQLSQLIQLSGPKVLLGGDFNCVPWSPSLKNFLSDAELADELKGYRPTWPSTKPLLPLDHFFWRGNWNLKTIRVESSWGSDHLALQIQLASEF